MDGGIDLTAIAGLPVRLDPETLTLVFGDGITTEPLAQRRIDDIRPMLPDPDATGPDPLYSIYMDVRVPGLADDLHARGLRLPEIVRVRRPRSQPSLALAHALYEDATREPELVRRADPVHPLFVPPEFDALSA